MNRNFEFMFFLSFTTVVSPIKGSGITLGEDHFFSALMDEGLVNSIDCWYNKKEKLFIGVYSLGVRYNQSSQMHTLRVQTTRRSRHIMRST